MKKLLSAKEIQPEKLDYPEKPEKPENLEKPDKKTGGFAIFAIRPS
ncbi:MAG: hypothetical protein J6Y97_05020 [Prevotella sp.]|nr:hypothetical protein [Prevotella sp.]MBP5506687.1 hypothetical protein [Prevotella sp.]